MDILLIILEQVCIHIPLLCGTYISFSLMKVPDLSIESAYVTGALLGSKMVLVCAPYGVIVQAIGAVVGGMLGGILVGFTSSMLTHLVRMPHLLSTIITFGLFYGINQYISGIYITLNTTVNPLVIPLSSRYPELVALLFFGVAVYGLLWYLLQTQLGYAWAVYGLNQNFFKHYGIQKHVVFISGITVSNALAGLSGYLFAQSNGFAEINMAFGKVLLCITALILGKALMGHRKPMTSLLPITGGFAYFALQQLLLRVGFNLRYFSTIQALVVLAVLLSLRGMHVESETDHLGV